MNYRIIALVEDSVYDKGLQGEHGLSLLIEAGEHKVLFDTGASDLFIQNARLIGINLVGVGLVVLSHGHRDYTGGLHTFLKMNNRAKVVCRQKVFHRRFKGERENGMLHPEALSKSCFWLINETTEIVPGVFAFPDVRIVDGDNAHFKHFFVEIGGEMRPDTFENELTLILKSGKSLSVLGVYSHRGIINIIRVVQIAFPGLGLRLVMGSSHIHNADIEKFNMISAFPGMKLPKRLGVCHCTDVNKYALSHQQFNDRVFYNYTGWVETVQLF